MPLFWPVILNLVRVIAVIVGPFIALHTAGSPTVSSSTNSKRKWLQKKKDNAK
jgi:hypothetical protein